MSKKKLYLSASSIADIMSCPAKFRFRRAHTKQGENEAIAIGLITHNAIEHCGNYDDALVYAEKHWAEYCGLLKNSFLPTNKKKKPSKSFATMLGNYYHKIVPSQHFDDKEDLIEYKFKYDYNKDIVLVGMFDRLSKYRIYDWKTSGWYVDEMDTSLQSIQFYIYYLAFQELFKVAPLGVYYGHLLRGMVYNVDIHPELLDNTHRVIARAYDMVKRGDPKDIKVTGYQCNTCLYRDACFRESRCPD